MKITILCENQTGYKGSKVCLSEWGLSLFIEINGLNLLFDTGHTDVYKRNAERLGIILDKVDFVILSHHHWDHADGLQAHNFKSKKKLIIHPEILTKLLAKESEKIKNDFKIVASVNPLEFFHNAYYLGEIPRQNTFENGAVENDLMRDDSAIVIKTKNGAVVITGCSHSGICNICEYAKKVTGKKIYAVIGGFHLFEDNQEAIAETIEYFKTEKPKFLYPMHCVDFPTLAKFHEVFGIKKMSTGDVIELED
ncbi:MAG: MBL fold metallo-hydrolase [bacterium]